MAKVIKILGRTLGVFFEWILIAVILFAFLIRTSTVQSYLAKQATSFFSEEWKTKVQIGKVDITLFNRVYLEDVLIHDLSDKRLVSIRSLEVLLKDFGAQHVSIDELILDRGEVWVYAENPTGNMNFQFIVDYFSSDYHLRRAAAEELRGELLVALGVLQGPGEDSALDLGEGGPEREAHRRLVPSFGAGDRVRQIRDLEARVLGEHDRALDRDVGVVAIGDGDARRAVLAARSAAHASPTRPAT